MDATGEGVFGFVFEVRVWTLTKRQPVKPLKKKKITHFSSPIKQREESSELVDTCRSEEVLSMCVAWIGGTAWSMGAPVL